MKSLSPPRCNRYREVTGEGFSFLKIPRAYYGALAISQLQSLLSDEEAEKIVAQLKKDGLVDECNVVELYAAKTEVVESLEKVLGKGEKVYDLTDAVAEVVLKARYSNMFQQMGETFSAAE